MEDRRLKIENQRSKIENRSLKVEGCCWQREVSTDVLLEIQKEFHKILLLFLKTQKDFMRNSSVVDTKRVP